MRYLCEISIQQHLDSKSQAKNDAYGGLATIARRVAYPVGCSEVRQYYESHLNLCLLQFLFLSLIFCSYSVWLSPLRKL